MGSNCTDGSLDIDQMLFLLDQRPDFDSFILTCRDNNFSIDHDTQAANIFRVAMIVGNKTTSSERINFMHFNNFIFAGCQNIRMEILSAQYGIIMTG